MRDWMRRLHRMSDDEFAAEVEAHLAHETDAAVERGIPCDEARYIALRRFGNVTRHLERFREASPWFWLETLGQDIRYSVRGLRRTPWFSVAALTSLAVGIGLNTVLFSGFDAVLFRPLPYPEPDRLVSIGQSGGGTIWPAIFGEWQRRSTVFETMGVAD